MKPTRNGKNKGGLDDCPDDSVRSVFHGFPHQLEDKVVEKSGAENRCHRPEPHRKGAFRVGVTEQYGSADQNRYRGSACLDGADRQPAFRSMPDYRADHHPARPGRHQKQDAENHDRTSVFR